MVCEVKIYEKPCLKDPVLIEGLPGIGLVANIAVAYLIRTLNAKLFGEIRSSHFHDVVITDRTGALNYPINQLYYYNGRKDERDLILLYGNTQSLTSSGQYELCGHILDITKSLGCRFVITLGGYRPGRSVTKPKLYFAASDSETAKIARGLNAEVPKVHIFGFAGLLVGMCKLFGVKGLCLLVETPGNYPDKEAASELLRALSEILKIKIDLSGLGEPADLVRVLSPFDFGSMSESKKRKSEPGWLV
ncbi:MAG: PAC2 family protein [Candidatus Bathyarchaeia archaeon]